MNNKSKKEEKQDHVLVPVKQDAEALIALAIEKNVSVDTMERLLAMRRELKAERAKEEFDKAMSAFQAECPIIKKTKAVTTDSGEVAFKYAPLECIVEQVKEFLSKNGFSYSVDQSETEPGYIKVALTVKHTFGHFEVTSVRLALGNKTRLMSQTQVEAATLTFAKRYAFCNAFGILTGDEDIDAQPETAGEGSSKTAHAGNRQRNGYGHVTAKQAGFIKVLLNKKGYREKDLMIKYEVTGISQLASSQASQIIENLQKLPDISDADREAEQIANDAAAALS
jgi:ERF superfamily protein